MSGYFDANAEARMSGYALGRLEGYENGKSEGLQRGHAEGLNEGYNVGWDEAIAAANTEMIKQKKITQDYASKNNRLTAEALALRAFIERMRAELDTLKGDQKLLQLSNNDLRQRYVELVARNQELERERIENVYHSNRHAVFMNSARSVLEELTDETELNASKIRTMFAKRYSEHVDDALQKKTILIPLEKDEVVTRTMPKTQRFIRRMLEK